MKAAKFVAVIRSAVAIGVLGKLAVAPHSPQADVCFSRNNGHQADIAEGPSWAKRRSEKRFVAQRPKTKSIGLAFFSRGQQELTMRLLLFITGVFVAILCIEKLALSRFFNSDRVNRFRHRLF
jgi:hypothetical protein